MGDNEIISRIAQKIRITRLQKNLTIQQLATRMHVSKGLLSKIENSKTVPSLPVFVTMLQSLEISPKEFFEDMLLSNGRKFVLIKKEQRSSASREGFDYQQITSQNLPHCSMEVSLVTIQPGAGGKVTVSEGYEFRYMLSGSCEYELDHEMLLLEEGDALYIDASVPRTVGNYTRKSALMLCIQFVLAGR